MPRCVPEYVIPAYPKREPKPLRGLLFRARTLLALPAFKVLIGAISGVKLVAPNCKAFLTAINEAIAGMSISMPSSAMRHSLPLAS
jgi:hypothetical protein